MGCDMHHLQTKGRIFNIQRYSLHDGAGIRTIVFLKGCFLRCRWCCNPESQKYEIEIMGTETIGHDTTVQEIMAKIERDMPYYRRSGGGLTLSGGEALAQPDFSCDLLKAAHETGINTAIESTAIVDFCQVEKVLPYMDEFLLDIKHTNPIKHQEFTGKRNDLALENAKKISQYNNVNLIIRVPVIPGFNSTEAEITDIASFAATLPGVGEIHLLPYHRFGEGKYTALGREYPMGDVKTPSAEEMQKLQATVMSATKLHCKIGG